MNMNEKREIYKKHFLEKIQEKKQSESWEKNKRTYINYYLGVVETLIKFGCVFTYEEHDLISDILEIDDGELPALQHNVEEANLWENAMASM